MEKLVVQKCEKKARIRWAIRTLLDSPFWIKSNPPEKKRLVYYILANDYHIHEGRKK